MRINPTAVVFWVFTALVGYLIGGTDGALAGGTIGIGLSFLLEILP